MISETPWAAIRAKATGMASFMGHHRSPPGLKDASHWWKEIRK
jgi:hypothetical protein